MSTYKKSRFWTIASVRSSKSMIYIGQTNDYIGPDNCNSPLPGDATALRIRDRLFILRFHNCEIGGWMGGLWRFHKLRFHNVYIWKAQMRTMHIPQTVYVVSGSCKCWDVGKRSIWELQALGCWKTQHLGVASTEILENVASGSCKRWDVGKLKTPQMYVVRLETRKCPLWDFKLATFDQNIANVRCETWNSADVRCETWFSWAHCDMKRSQMSVVIAMGLCGEHVVAWKYRKCVFVGLEGRKWPLWDSVFLVSTLWHEKIETAICLCGEHILTWKDWNEMCVWIEHIVIL